MTPPHRTLLMQRAGPVTQGDEQASNSEARMSDDDQVRCYGCPHDIDEHDEHARCLTTECACGW